MYNSEVELASNSELDSKSGSNDVKAASSSDPLNSSLAEVNQCTAQERRARVKAWLVSGIGTQAFDRLQQAFGSLEAAWSSDWREWEYKGFSKRLWEAWQQGSKLEASVDRVLLWADQVGNYLLFKDDLMYPSMMSSVPGMPSILFIKGKISLLNEPQVAIVGSRTPTREGSRNAYDMAFYLAERGVSVVSGLAKGIDTAAHQGAVKAGGPTIAVVAHGLDQIYPKSNQKLAEEITSLGLLVSEFPLGMSPRPQHFPRRNGVISGLSLGIVVVEAALRSGSLITAKWGLEQGREVFAIPGSIHNPLSKGCHHLIRQGAKLVESAADIFEELAPSLKRYVDRSSTQILEAKASKQTPVAEKPYSTSDLAPIAVKGLNLLQTEPLSLDQLMIHLNLPAHELTSHLLMLELEGLVVLTPKGYDLTELGRASV